MGAFDDLVPKGAPSPSNGGAFDDLIPKAGKGTILPISWDKEGNTSVDLTAGITGSLWRALTAPGDVYTGKLDPYSTEGKLRAFEMAGWINPTNPAIASGDRAFPGKLMATRQPKPTIPTAGELKDAAGRGYNAARATGAEYPGASVSGLAGDIQRALEADGFLSENAPKTFGILKRLGAEPNEPSTVTIASLDAARRSFSKVTGDGTEREASRRVVSAIDDFIQAGGRSGSMAGTATASGEGAANLPRIGGTVEENPLVQAARLIQDARANAAARFRSDRITGVEDAAEMRAATANSGQNLGNSLRQRLAGLLLDDKRTRGLNEEELTAIRQVVDGTASSNTLRRVSNWLGGGGGVGQTVVSALGSYGGAQAGGAPGAVAGMLAAPLAGSAARSGYNSLVQRQVDLVDQLTRMRSPLYQQRVAATPPEVISPLLRSLPIRPPIAMAPSFLDQEDPRFSVWSAP